MRTLPKINPNQPITLDLETCDPELKFTGPGYITGIGHNLVKPAKIKEIIIDENGIKDLYVTGDGHNFENSFDIFYLSKEQAEQALLKN